MPDKRPRIMLVAADPVSTTEDLLQEEANIIRKAFNGEAAEVNVTVAHTFKGDVLKERLRSDRPSILQFTGHGSPTGRIFLENVKGRLQRKSAKSIARILSQADIAADCIVLNNCSAGRSEHTP